MSVKFQDYYEVLGVSRTASADEISRAYRKLARKYHPDINKEKGAEDKFKKLNEANEVLKDPEKRNRYDALGANWKAGQEFRPPPGYENVKFNFGEAGAGFDFGKSGFSDFFDILFGARGSDSEAGKFSNFGNFGQGSGYNFSGADSEAREYSATHEAELRLPLEAVYRGGTQRVSLQAYEPGANTASVKTYDVKIPIGTTNGSVIRLAGQGGRNSRGKPGDLLLRVKLLPHPRFKVVGHDLITKLALSPWEAALGAKLNVPTLDGELKVTVAPGSQPGSRLRLRGQGLHNASGVRGDLFAELEIIIPKQLSPVERELLEKLSRESDFNPRTERETEKERR